MELDLHGKVALVTGASRGIGAAICLELASEDVHLCFNARDQAALEDIARRCREAGQVTTLTQATDLREPAAAGTAVMLPGPVSVDLTCW